MGPDIMVAMSERVRAYGDDTNDGKVQVSFTLPIPSNARAEAAARDLARQMRIERSMVVHQKPLGPRRP